MSRSEIHIRFRQGDLKEIHHLKDLGVGERRKEMGLRGVALSRYKIINMIVYDCFLYLWITSDTSVVSVLYSLMYSCFVFYHTEDSHKIGRNM